MTIRVIDFYRRTDKKNGRNPYIQELEDPTFYILSYVNGKVRELTLKLSGKFECPLLDTLRDFDIESYRNYIIIVNFLLGEDGEKVQRSWGITKKDLRELIFELYFTLIRVHATCGWFKKALLIAVGMWKFFMGRKIK